MDEIDRDCILNHRSNAKPTTKEGEIFRYADGLSLFVPKTINFKFYGEAKEGQSFENISKDLKKYKEKYADSKEVMKLLEDLEKTLRL